ncbi:MAG: FlgD immunoglobulin-like domain containing protein [Candidatus Krumholzibacteriia bacterium]
MPSLRLFLSLAVTAVCVHAAAAAFAAGDPLSAPGPVSAAYAVRALDRVPTLAALPVDREAARNEDADREAAGLAPRFALPQEVSITPETDGSWEALDDRWLLWRLRITAPGATSLNLGFSRYRLPKNSRLTIAPADAKEGDDPRGVRVFTERDNEDHGELWTPVVIGDDIVVELVLPAVSRHDYALELAAINRGYRFFDELYALAEADKAGSCNIDVVCAEGDDWRLEINAVGVISTGGSTFCTGSMLNNTAGDETPYFLTANHCGINAGNAASLVVYWNFQSPTCGAQSGGSLADFQTGSTFLAASATSDFTLVLMDDAIDPAHEVSFAGWDRSGADATMAVAIHHPSTDEKSISFEYEATTITDYLGTAVPGDGTHVRVIDWDLGTTEPGSSGSPLFDQNHRVIGQLHGGYAACGNDESDWYGRLFTSWNAIAGWLDPLGTGAMTTDTHAPWATGLAVAGGGFAAAGDAGGPFAPDTHLWTVTNNSAFAVDYAVAVDVAWLDVTGGSSGTLAAGASADVTAALNAAAAALPIGAYAGAVTFTNLTDGDGTTSRGLALTVGVPSLQLAFTLDEDPGWTTDTGWAFGVPTGGGGAYGEPDPTSGYTGANVYGYNLGGDYPNNMPERHLTSTAIDCTNLGAVSVKFRRWLNVEQPSYDHAYFRVSSDGTTWTTVWSNGGEITDTAWIPVEFDISAVADGQPTVYLRWTMGTTDGSWTYSGWNVDDVEIWGLASGLASAGDVPAPRLDLGNHPNPFNPLTRITFAVDRDGPAVLAVYDVQGRLVRRLAVGTVATGEHTVVWDGSDDGGRRVGSGVYFARLAAGGQVVQHKMVMLK